MFEAIVGSFRQGGWGMFPIAVVAICVIAIAAERTAFLFIKARINKNDFVYTLQKYLYDGNLQRAITYCAGHRAPLANIVRAALLQAYGNEEEIRSAMDTMALKEVPRIEQRTGYLAMLGNVAVLCGLLGTISGLIRAFGAVTYIDTADRATVLASGISEAMNCTAFGLGIAIPTLVLFSILSGAVQHLIADIDEGKLRTLNLILANQGKLGAGDLADAQYQSKDLEAAESP